MPLGSCTKKYTIVEREETMRIALVGFAPHQKSRSEDFFVSILERNGIEVHQFWSDGWQGGEDLSIRKLEGFSAIVMWQVACRAFRPYARYCDNITFVPMLDNHVTNTPEALAQLRRDRNFWQMFGETKILSFSKTLHEAMRTLGLYSRYFQCFAPPAPRPVQRDGRHGFFWLRREDVISMDIIAKLTEGTQFDSMHVHIGSNSKHTDFTVPQSWQQWNVTVSTWFDNADSYRNLLSEKNIFFAPRPVEGIGFSFLEAMGRGHCVVAPNFPTMNEYLQHGQTGLLYDLQAPQPLCFDGISAIGRRAWELTTRGYAQWQGMQEELLEYILAPNRKVYAAWTGQPLRAHMPLKRKILNLKMLRPFFRCLSRCKARWKKCLP